MKEPILLLCVPESDTSDSVLKQTHICTLNVMIKQTSIHNVMMPKKSVTMRSVTSQCWFYRLHNSSVGGGGGEGGGGFQDFIQMLIQMAVSYIAIIKTRCTSGSD